MIGAARSTTGASSVAHHMVDAAVWSTMRSGQMNTPPLPACRLKVSRCDVPGSGRRAGAPARKRESQPAVMGSRPVTGDAATYRESPPGSAPGQAGRFLTADKVDGCSWPAGSGGKWGRGLPGRLLATAGKLWPRPASIGNGSEKPVRGIRESGCTRVMRTDGVCPGAITTGASRGLGSKKDWPQLWLMMELPWAHRYRLPQG